MNKLGVGLIFKSFQIKNIRQFKQNKAIAFSFASSKQTKDNKQAQVKKQQNASSEIVKKAKTLSQQKALNTKASQTKSIMSEQQKKELILKQKIHATYNQLQSLPSDSYQTVVQNFKRIKGKLMDRKVYIPNKPQLMAQLDRDMQFVKKHHTIWKAPSTAPQRKVGDSKSEIIEWELQQAKKNYYLSLLENEKFLIGVATSVIVVFAWMEYYYYVREEDKREALPKMVL